jgi:hypothetical protein
MRYWTLYVRGEKEPEWAVDQIECSHTMNAITTRLQNAAWDASHGLDITDNNGEVVWTKGDGDPVFVVSSYLWPPGPEDDQTQEGKSDGE